MAITSTTFKKGDNRKRKSKGDLNRTTKEAKEILNNILFGEIDNIKLALEEIREKDNYRYIDCLSKLFPFVIAKKTDVTSGDETLPKNININVTTPESAKELKKFLDGKPQ